MITITNIRDAKSEEYDEIWAIVRSLKNKSKNLIQVEELSPSWDLFKKYLDLKDKGLWNEESFQNIYRPIFIEQINNDSSAQRKINELIEKDKEGKSIALVCFCKDVNLCHRKLVSDILTERGIKHTLS